MPNFRNISGRESVELVEQLVSLTRSGLPLPSGLRAAGEELDSRPLRATFLELAVRIDAGEGLGGALASASARFPAHLRGLVLAGARSGRLADVLGEYVRTANLAAELRRKCWSALLYPMASLAAVLGIVAFVCHIAASEVEGLIDGLNGISGPGKPAEVVVLVLVTRFIDRYWPAFAIGAIGVAAATWASMRIAMTPARRRRFLCGMPMIGPMLRSASLAEFCRLLAMLLEAELPLPAALELAGAGIRDADVAEACGRMGRAVESGESLAGALRHWGSIPAGLGQLLGWSEAHRDLPGSLRMVGDMCEARARSQGSFAASVLSTLLVLMTFWWIGFAVAALYLPTWTTIDRSLR